MRGIAAGVLGTARAPLTSTVALTGRSPVKAEWPSCPGVRAACNLVSVRSAEAPSLTDPLGDKTMGGAGSPAACIAARKLVGGNVNPAVPVVATAVPSRAGVVASDGMSVRAADMATPQQIAGHTLREWFKSRPAGIDRSEATSAGQIVPGKPVRGLQQWCFHLPSAGTFPAISPASSARSAAQPWSMQCLCSAR